jgi:hypothetical protein
MNDEVKTTGTYTDQLPQKVADELGLVLIEPPGNVLLLDLDSPEDCDVFADLFPLFQRRFPDAHYMATVSKSGTGRHVYVRCPGHTFGLKERLLYQACLGSDRKRELLAITRVEKNWDHVSVLFETCEQAEKIKEWLNGA